MTALTSAHPAGGRVAETSATRVPTLAYLALFLGITFALTWAAFLPFVLGALRWDTGEGQWLRALGIVAPSLTAFVLTARAAGRAGARRLGRRGVHWRVGAGWYAFVLGVPGLASITGLAATALGGRTNALHLSVEVVAAAAISGLLAGTFEEFGWCGFAFPALQGRYGFLWSGVAMGAIVALWHAPFFFSPGSTQSSSSFVFFLLQLIPARILFNWIYNGTGGSVLLPILFHASWNAWGEVLETGPMVADAMGLTQTAFLVAAAAAVLLLKHQITPRPAVA